MADEVDLEKFIIKKVNSVSDTADYYYYYNYYYYYYSISWPVIFT